MAVQISREKKLSNYLQTRSPELQKIYNDRADIRRFQGSFKNYEEKYYYITKFPGIDDEMHRFKVENFKPFNVPKRTIEILTAKPFQIPAVIECKDERIKAFELNFDGKGNTITRVLMKMFQRGLWDTQAHAFIDFPTAKKRADGSPIYDPTLKPIVTILNNDNILDVDGADNNLDMLRFEEKFTKYINEFERVELKRIKHYKKTNGKVVCYIFEQKEKNGDISKVSQNTITLPYIPCISFKPMDIYDSAFFPESNIFDPMIQQTIDLFNVDCDLGNIVSISCFPLLTATGFGENAGDDEDDGVNIGPNNIIMSNNKDAKIAYVENTGSAQQNAFKRIEIIMDRINQLGFEMMTEVGGNATAMAHAIDAAGNNATIGNFAINLQDTAAKIIKVMCDWMRIDTTNIEYSVDVKTDYSVKTSPDEMNAIMQAYQTGALTGEQYFFELRKRGILDENAKFRGVENQNIDDITIE